MPCSRAASITARPSSRGMRSNVRQEPSDRPETSRSDAPSLRLGMAGSGGKPYDLPAPVRVGCIEEPVVHPARAGLPELVPLGVQAVAAPRLAERKLGLGVAICQCPRLLLEPLAARDGTALGRGERAELAAPRPAVRVGERFLTRGALDRALDSYLAPERLPVEEERGAGVGGQLPALAALVVRVEDEAGGVGVLEEHHPDRWRAVGRCGGERHRLGLRDAYLRRLLEPALELTQRIGIGALLAERDV